MYLFAHAGHLHEEFAQTTSVNVETIVVGCLVAAFVGFCLVLFIKQR